MISLFKSKNIRTSIFVDPVKEMIDGAAILNTDRVELYTENYAANYHKNPEEAVKHYTHAAKLANKLEIGINAGHDLNLKNLPFLMDCGEIKEVSIGQAYVSDCLIYGIKETTNKYLEVLK